MAEAIMKGVLAAGLFKAGDLLASDTSEARLKSIHQKYGIRTTRNNREAVREGDLVILGVKPLGVDGVLAEVKSELKEKVLVSVAAGVPLARLAAGLEREAKIIRAMPNAPALVQAGATVLAPGKGVEQETLDLVLQIFDSIGKSWILEERYLDAVTGLSGSGPAFVFVMIEAMADGGVKSGLSREVALALAVQTVLGAAQMALQTGDHPARLKDFVASPGGTTIAGLHKLEEGKVRSAFISAVEAATRRSEELGKTK
ncbi:pyrroline-5-carboxylate reductase [Nitrospiraceae bacterium HYJII51-Mn-bac16s-1-B09]|uniref:Pyrroline-5-carboxylate reductase n=2 Tax=Candidatus Manganitrophus noduliformans TaxID=2606439 RepID=A0A7X6DNC2_9BACT|nr:pyrroline-5-carboxylate reductase [Candidatus Manganitrophus noduliformans]